jgi:hypothetical protein
MKNRKKMKMKNKKKRDITENCLFDLKQKLLAHFNLTHVISQFMFLAE